MFLCARKNRWGRSRKKIGPVLIDFFECSPAAEIVACSQITIEPLALPCFGRAAGHA